MTLIILASLLFLLLLAFYGWLAARSTARAVLATQPFGMADVFCAGVLALWMVSVIAQSYDGHQGITFRAIIGNSLFYICLIMGIFGVIGFQGKSAIAIFHLQPSSFQKAACMGLLWLFITCPLIPAAQVMIQQIFGSSNDSQLIVKYFLEHPDLKHRAAVVFMVVILAPIAEEVIFRGYFYGVIRRYAGRIPAIAISSLLFAAIHVHLPSLLALGILGVILCLLYERVGSLWAPITMHAAFNASNIVALILWPEAVPK